MISIIIPLYNKEKQIRATLQSVFQQTFCDYEIIIVNDGSTDGSCDEVHKLSDSRIRLFHQSNAGVSAARNRGIAEAKGEYVTFLDADDEWKPDYLATQYALTQKYPQCSVFAVNYEFRNEKGETTPTIIRKLPFSGNDGILTNYFEMASCSHPPLWTSAVMVRKEAIQSVGGFPIGIKSGEDLLTWARLACRYAIVAYSTTSLAVFCVTGYDVKEKPKRVPAEDDVVGRELLLLAQQFRVPGIKSYISLWHKMRSSVYMRLGMKKKSIREALTGLRYRPTNYKLYAYILINMLPERVRSL